MDAGACAGLSAVQVKPPRPAESLWTTGKFVFSDALTLGLARQALRIHPLLAGWVGMTGLIFCLHFGAFHLLALGWRQMGVPLEPFVVETVTSSAFGETARFPEGTAILDNAFVMRSDEHEWRARGTRRLETWT